MTVFHKRGTVLLEALVAVVILSIGLSLIIQSMVQNLKIGRQSILFSQAVFLADDRMFDLLRARYAQDIEMPAQGRDGLFAVQIKNGKDRQDDRLNHLHGVEVVVSFKDGKQDRMLDAEVWMLRKPEQKSE